MAVTIYTYRTPIGTDGTLWNTSGTYRLKTGNNFDLWCKVVDTGTVSPSAPTASTTSGFFSVGTITTKSSSGDTWIGTIRLIAGTSTTNTSQTLSIKYGSTTYTCNVRVNGTTNGFSTNPTLASNFTYDDSNHAPITAWGASKSANLHWAMSTSNVVPPDSGWANALSSFTSVMRNAGTYYLWYKMQSTSTTYNDVPPTLYGTSITCSKATLTCTGSSHTVTYGAAAPTLSITYSGWKGDDGTSDLTTRPTVSTTYTSSSNVSGSPYPVTVSGGSATNYSFSYVNGSITVNKAASRLELIPNSTSAYTQSTVNVSNFVNKHDGTLSYAITASTTTGTSSITSAGVVTCGTMSTSNDTDQSITVTVSDAGDGNHNSGSKTFTITVQKYTATITFNNSTTSVTYGNTLSVAATATASGGTVGSFTYSLSSTTYLTISGSTVTAVQYSGSTTTTVTATLARTSTVKAGTKTRTIYVTAKTATFTWGTVTWTYDKTAHSTTCTVSNLVSGDTCTVTLSGNSITNAGTTTCTITGLSNSNYQLPGAGLDKTLTVNPLTATLSWGTTQWTYDKSSHSTTCTVGNLKSGDSCTVTLTGNSITNAGTTTVTASSLSNSNYGLPAVNYTTLTVNAKEVTLTWGTVTWTYDTGSHATTCTAGSLISGDSCTVNLTGNSIGPNVGTATVTASSLSNSNYKLPSSKTATLSITQRAVSLSWGTITWTYDGSTHSTTCTATDLLPQTSCTVTLTGNSVGKNVGTATVTASGLSNSNYKLPTSGTSKTLTINAKEVTLTWGTTSWEYDKTAHGTTCTAGSLVTGDTCTVTLTNNSITNVGSVTVTASSLSNSNYKLPSSKTKNIYITAKTVSLTWGTVTWTYDKATHSTTCTAGGVISGDTCTITLSNNSVGPDVGTKTVSATALSNSNYQLPAAGLEKTISITAKEVTLTWGTTSWVYNGNTRSTTCTLGGIISGDTCTLTLSGNSVGPHVGSATVTASSLSNSNYKLPSSKTKTISITQATTTLTWTSYTSSMRVGDTQTVSASTNFGTVSYSSSSTSVATVSGAVVTAKTNGTTTITASVATNTYGDWTAASVTFTLTVACGMKVYFDGQYRDAAVYVYYNNQWKKAIPYIYDGTSWKSC